MQSANKLNYGKSTTKQMLRQKMKNTQEEDSQRLVYQSIVNRDIHKKEFVLRVLKRWQNITLKIVNQF